MIATRIKGIEKVSLIDYPGKVCSVVFLGGCNLRCPYCHNSDLISYSRSDNEMRIQELLSFLRKRKGLIEGVTISGGEPLSTNGIVRLAAEAKNIGLSVKLDTNGFYPDKTESLIKRRLIDYVAMDIKNCKEKYVETVGNKNIDISKIDRSIDIIRGSDIEYEFRTTVCRELHKAEDIENILQWIEGSKVYILQQFHKSLKVPENKINPFNEKEFLKIRGIYINKVGKIMYRGFAGMGSKKMA